MCTRSVRKTWPEKNPTRTCTCRDPDGLLRLAKKPCRLPTCICKGLTAWITRGAKRFQSGTAASLPFFEVEAPADAPRRIQGLEPLAIAGL